MQRDTKEGWTGGQGFVVGLVIGALVGVFLAAPIGFVFVKRSAREARAGWNLVPVVVVNQNLAAGDAISFEKISQRPIPEQFQASTSVLPASAKDIIGARLRYPLKAGDPLLWTHLEDGEHRPAPDLPGMAENAAQGDEPSDPEF